MEAQHREGCPHPSSDTHPLSGLAVQIPGAAAAGGIEGTRTLCWMSAPRGGMSQRKGVGMERCGADGAGLVVAVGVQ